MNEKYYTPQNEHPEDRILRDKEFIERLTDVQGECFIQLAHDLNLNEDGYDWLFDYLYNNDDKELLFGDFLDEHDLSYGELVGDFDDECCSGCGCCSEDDADKEE